LVCEERGVVYNSTPDKLGVNFVQRDGMGLLEAGDVPEVIDGAVKLYLRARLNEGAVEEGKVEKVVHGIAFDGATTVPGGRFDDILPFDDAGSDQFGCGVLRYPVRKAVKDETHLPSQWRSECS
jgi:hypothetical protein